MKWKKLGKIFVADNHSEWMKNYAYLPTTLLLNDEIIRVYVVFCDDKKIGRIGYVDVYSKNPLKIIEISSRPSLDIGLPGTFDDSGVSPTQIIKDDQSCYMLYIGWQLGVNVRYSLLAGLAKSDDQGQFFNRMQKIPLLDRTNEELFIRSAPFVIKEKDTWKMWYIGGSKWISINNKLAPSYKIKYLESLNLFDWPKKSQCILNFANEDEYGFGRPYLIKENELYKMWYSIRTYSKGYRLGYAESENGLNWERKDHLVGINVSDSGWDSQMICYSAIQKTKHGTYLFYNGNNYGETGFGVAILEE